MPFKIQDSQLRQRVLHYVIRKKKKTRQFYCQRGMCGTELFTDIQEISMLNSYILILEKKNYNNFF